MAMHFVTEPANARTLVDNALESLATRPSLLTQKAVDLTAKQISEPHAVYDLRADAIASGNGLSSASHTGFRYVVSVGGAHVAAAEVLVDKFGAATHLANVNYGPYVEATVNGFSKASDLTPVKTQDYEVRLLRFSAIMVMALWLKPDAGGGDIIYPLAPVPEGLKADHPYSEQEFLQAIRPLAEKRVAKKDPHSVP